MPLLPPKASFFSNRSITSTVAPLAQQLFPPLSSSLHKGECGRIGVVGGSPTYTGAPFFAAITALRVGADMVHVFAPLEAAMVIKSYSPELMVHPSLDRETLRESLHRLDALVLGPGLGRAESSLSTVEHVVEAAREKKLPLIIDADGLFFIGKRLDIIRGYSKAILTPNFPEFERLYEAAFSGKKIDQEKLKNGEAANELARELGCTIFQKGGADIIANGSEVQFGNDEGSPRRCGGQGDLLSGTLAVFFYWAEKKNVSSPAITAGQAGSQFIRTAAKDAFKKHGRSMVAGDIINEIPSLINAIDAAGVTNDRI